MANETKPQSGNTATGAKVGNAGHPEQGQQEAAGSSAREDKAAESPKRGPSETKPPGRRH